MGRILAITFLCLSCTASTAENPTAPLDRIRISSDGRRFIHETSGERFTMWGVNYDHDDAGRLIEDYWETEWNAIEEDFQEIKELGANVVRIHLQLARFLETKDRIQAGNLQRFKNLIRLAERKGLYLIVTGLGCYHKMDVPSWYDKLNEADRWDVQERFWRAIAAAGKGSPAVLSYDLMNEPIVPGEKPETDWLAGEFGGKHFVQRIALSLDGRTREDVAKRWIKKLSIAIRSIDNAPLLTVGVIPWAQVFKGAKPLFYAPGVGDPLDFVSVHFYPKKNEIDGSLAALKVYDIGKPLVIEEIFPLSCSLEEAAEFIDRSRSFCDGWVSFYWGKTIAENERANQMKGAILAKWLRWFRENARPWSTIAALPDREGLAGSFVGGAGGALLLAGGANFPDRKPWEGGVKVWTDRIYCLERPGGTWHVVGQLPRPLGYGVSVTHGDSLVCVGGSDQHRHHADVFRLQWQNGQLSTTVLRSLPKPIANASGALVGETLYIVGGQETPRSDTALRSVYALDLTDPKAEWRELEPLPGRGRILAMAASGENALWIAGGVELVPVKDGNSQRRYLRDAYRYDRQNGWRRLTDLPRPLAAAPAVFEAGSFTILGGDDGTQFNLPPEKHRGFRKEILCWDARSNTWIESGSIPAPRVTTPGIIWNQRLIIASGEVRPGVRSSEIWTTPLPKR